MTTSDESFKKYLFDDICERLKERGFPFVFIEYNPSGVEYQIFTPSEEEFEHIDLNNLLDGINETRGIIECELTAVAHMALKS